MKKKRPKVDPEKLKKAVRGMEAKARELGWNPLQSAEEAKAAVKIPVFVYARISDIWGPWKRGKKGNQGGFELSWGAEKVGFGSFTFCMKDGKLICDTETMPMSFVRAAFDHLLRGEIVFEPNYR